nr:class I SAM-dependent methyltransferase [Acidaminobacter sp. JC074]
MYEAFDYKTWDDILLSKLSPKQLEAGEITHNKIVETLRSEARDWVLDIGTGRGILLKAMLEAGIKNIVCLDLSYEVLKCDRIKFLERFPHIEVNYIACDAKSLPFEDMTFDMAVSLAGFTNMHEEVHQALKESVRVSKKGVLSAATISECEHIKSVEEERFTLIHDLGEKTTIDTVIKEETFKVLMCQIKPS